MIEPYRVNADSTDLVELIAEQGLAVVDGLDGPEGLLRLAKSIAVVVPQGVLIVCPNAPERADRQRHRTSAAPA
ncbi:hypothetical protein [Lentzea nigeriaca]|uniref:hypothetical protein n=1 Tax=Lentzea nigeriaca TaxID=1128665 RepID=UPI001956A33D|nr:hypothetical protein [Lentzea nigeriaca]MBM7857926.1 hypothetical protein [Lentzea nigeriaca]